MKFDHLVKCNGVYYTAGMEVPIGDNTPKETSSAENKAETKAEPIVEEKATEKEVLAAEVNTPNVPKEEKSYTKTEINRMTTAELRKLAKKSGIRKADDYSGSELKTMLIEKLV